jgi:hypothetical protein
MAQGVLPFKYESEKKANGLTALGGLPAYLDFAQVIGLSQSEQKHIKLCGGFWIGLIFDFWDLIT